MLPEAEEVDVEIDQNDLQIDVYRSSGPGGQSVNTTDSAVRITHKPTGIVVSMQDEKSQLQNKDKAMRVLRARLLERELAEQQAKIASERKAQVGSGERSEKVRTYNFPQGRVTDHRIKHTSHNLDGVLGGELGEFTDALAAEEKRQRLEAAAAGVTPVGAAASAKRSAPRSTRCGRPGSRARASTPKLLLAEASGRGPGRAGRRSGGAELRAGGGAAASAKWCGAGCGASRSPTSSAARASAGSSWRSTAGCWSRGRRPSCWSKLALERRRGAVLDVGTGSGAIALAVADELPGCDGDGDRHLGRRARGGARQRRAARPGGPGPLPRAGHDARRGRASFDLVLANLPYVAERDWRALAARGDRMGAARGAARRPRRPRRLPRPRHAAGECALRLA